MRINANPNDVYHINLRGGINFYNLNKREKAKLDFSKAIKLSPNFIFPYTNRGWIHLLSQDYEDAEKDFLQHIKINPQSAFGYYKMGVLKYYQRKYSKAIQFFDKSIEINPSFNSAIYAKYFALKAINKSEIKLLEGLEEKRIPYSKLYTEKITPEIFLKEVNKIVDKQRFKKDSTMCEAHFALGKYWVLKKDTDKATEHFKRAIAVGKHTWMTGKLFSEMELNLIDKNDNKKNSE